MKVGTKKEHLFAKEKRENCKNQEEKTNVLLERICEKRTGKRGKNSLETHGKGYKAEINSGFSGEKMRKVVILPKKPPSSNMNFSFITVAKFRNLVYHNTIVSRW